MGFLGVCPLRVVRGWSGSKSLVVSMLRAFNSFWLTGDIHWSGFWWECLVEFNWVKLPSVDDID